MSEVFDPCKGHEETIRDGYRGDLELWFSSVPYSTLARDALYQGFVTDWEHGVICKGYGVFTLDGTLKWIKDLPGKPKGPYPDQKLTKDRREMIEAQQLLGIGDGDTNI